jgi:hypothetical protein
MYFRTEDLPQLVRDNPRRLPQIVHHPQTPVVDDGGFVHNLHKANYAEAAEALAKHPEEVKMSLEQHLAEQLRHSDDFIAARQYTKARQLLNDLMPLYGPRPEVRLRQAIVDISQGKVENAAQALNASKPKLSNRQGFFDEIDERLGHSAAGQTEHENLHRVAEFADWRDLQARRLVPPGEVRMVSEGDRLVIHYHLAEVPIGNPVLPKDIDVSTAFIYVQDSPGLNNLDWPAGLNHALDQAVSGRLATVVELPRGDIAHFNPTVIYTPDGATPFTKVSQSSKTNPAQNVYRSFSNTSGGEQDCKDGRSRPDCPRLTPAAGSGQQSAEGDEPKPRIYLVIANPSTSRRL